MVGTPPGYHGVYQHLYYQGEGSDDGGCGVYGEQWPVMPECLIVNFCELIINIRIGLCV